MNLLEQTKQLCRLYNIKPAPHVAGQNFLVKEEVYDKIVAQADLKSDDVVLEVGPGLGFLTAKLAAQAGQVMAVEIDRKLAEVLKIGLMAKEIKNVEVVEGDILKFSIFNFQFSNNFKIHPAPRCGTKFKIVANLPYNITSIFLRKFLSEAELRPELLVLMLQKEVAERICAKPGKMSLLAVSVQFYAQPQIVEVVPREYFWPEPEVDSTIIKLEVRSNHRRRGTRKLEVDERKFFQLVKFGFSAKRKMLKNNLAAGLRVEQTEAASRLKQAGFNEKIRAQELSVDDWLKLFGVFQEVWYN
jgi:16S rRNA (adenine1518-N6/adenine1519-N6)-dimethyltransferase